MLISLEKCNLFLICVQHVYMSVHVCMRIHMCKCVLTNAIGFMWKSEDNLMFWSSPSSSVFNRLVLLFSSWLTASEDSPTSTFCPVMGALGSQTWATASSFSWILGI